jgi:hypothetical protein
VNSKQNKKNRRIATPTPIKTSRNWFVVMPDGGVKVGGSVESVDDILADVVGLVEKAELVVVELVVVSLEVLLVAVGRPMVVAVIDRLMVLVVVNIVLVLAGVVVVEASLDKVELGVTWG